MASYYLDSSALVKRYSAEKGARFVFSLMRPSAKNRLYSVTIAEVEVCATLSRKRKALVMTATGTTKSILRFRRNFAARFVKSEVNDLLIEEALRLTDLYALRGYDAVHLAAALDANRDRLKLSLPPLILVSADGELNTAAQAEGLTVENPNNYP